MKKLLAALLSLVLLATMTPLLALAEEAAPVEGDAAPQAQTPPEDDVVTTKHTAVIQGREVAYTANAGTMVLKTGDKYCEIFFTAYTLDGVEDLAARPVTFAFNGGPGACSQFLHLGCLGPRRIDIDEKGYSHNMPVGLKDNDNSLLDLTDIVIIDAVGTGYSRPVGGAELSEFIGYENDNRTFGDFIYQYLDRNGRWGSPKYVAGESYGTTRAVGLCEYLANEYSVYLNGLILISSIHAFEAMLFENGNETPYALFFPTFAADAWYQGKVAEEYRNMELEAYLEQVRAFVEHEYVPALFIGNALTDEEKDAMAQKMSDYIGLSKKDILNANLRVSLEDFCFELLEDENLTVGRYDGRITGPVTSGSLNDGESDPSDAAFSLGFGNTVNGYFRDELEYRTDRPYIPMNGDVNDDWKFPIDDWGGYLNQEQTIYELISKNNFLKVWVLCGYFDGATPFYSAEWTFRHVFLNEALRDNVSMTYYHSGHMIYIEQASFDKFRKDAEAWYGR